MTARLIDGKSLAERLRRQVAAVAHNFTAASGRAPGLAVILVGDDPASQVYVASKSKQTIEAGMRSFEYRLPADASAATLLAQIAMLNADEAVDGILLQLPLPDSLRARTQEFITAIDPAKDVDGLHPINAGRLVADQPGLVPCTPLGAMMLLAQIHPTLDGLDAVVIGRSTLVGKPLSLLLLQQNATVTMAHSRTSGLAQLCQRADILVAAVGRPEFVTADFIKPGATIIDVGINRIEREGKSRLVGDVDFASVADVAGAITPVPGGVGPMTVACLLANTLNAAEARLHLPRSAWLRG
ncbi:MAG: bifunctional methylenetetrahydrofolate dehydrogenase/methenyltetrahydrofolate cyclohydrolase FolD [Hyphomicrobiales bacterium]|nr:bifunctional methylenetetrahydrofolate dehydrogenase/methenyltetrahydrofolate cyclohydrolase FolD [Hyphomicrobiales bacterium]OQW83479.1 MAG: bifunctional methylenetetrahydrofolate dehydrogenase/methenyltetrahydrofolate cyclohydrolase [Proteobacteria bacterium ST_bin15]